MENTIINIAAIVAILLPIFNVYAAIKLRRIYERHREIEALKERSLGATANAVASVCGGLLGISRITTITTGESLFPGLVGLFIILGVVLVPSIPNIIWLNKYRRNDFGNGKHGPR
jgi:hypothetical protein